MSIESESGTRQKAEFRVGTGSRDTHEDLSMEVGERTKR
jgi:hypothetical protein